MIFLNGCMAAYSAITDWSLFDAVFIGSFPELLHAASVVSFYPDYADNTAQSICHKAHVFVCVQADGRK